MKKPLLLMFLATIVLAGCSQQKLSQDQLFEKKQECANLQDKMWEQLNSTERYGDRVEGTTLYLTKVFYSPIKNSCLYKSEFIFDSKYVLEINDYFTKEVLYTYNCDSKDPLEYNKCSDMLKNKIQELMGE